MTNWSTDEQVWHAMDRMITEMDFNTRDLLDKLVEYKPDIPQIFQVLLFSCLGKFVVAYSECRALNEEGEPHHPPQLAFAIALQSIAEDPAAKALMEGSINNMIDRKVGGMF